jgi:hypothetical protein
MKITRKIAAGLTGLALAAGIGMGVAAPAASASVRPAAATVNAPTRHVVALGAKV